MRDAAPHDHWMKKEAMMDWEALDERVVLRFSS